MTARRRRRPDDEAGFTLVEMGITMLIMSVIFTIIITVVMTAENTASSAQQRYVATADAETTLEVVSRELRATVPIDTTASVVAIVSASANAVSFYSSLGATIGGAPAPTLVTLSIAPVGTTGYDQLIDSQVAPGGTAQPYTFTGRPVTRVDGYWLSPQAGNAAGAIFQYYGQCSPVPLASPVSSANLPTIASVEVTITSSQGPNQAEATVQTMVYLPNLADGLTGVTGVSGSTGTTC
jgi:type II secretory pathway pseudopilin PulG